MIQGCAAKNFPVVCVSGSAGGLDAYTRLLRRLPNDMGVAIVIVNHLRIVATQLHEILPRFTGMPVELITDGLVLRPNHVFIIPSQRDLPRSRRRVPPQADFKTQGMAGCHYGFPAFPDAALERQNYRDHRFRL
jgi:chemotaxis response regulator CheB